MLAGCRPAPLREMLATHRPLARIVGLLQAHGPAAVVPVGTVLPGRPDRAELTATAALRKMRRQADLRRARRACPGRAAPPGALSLAHRPSWSVCPSTAIPPI